MMLKDSSKAKFCRLFNMIRAGKFQFQAFQARIVRSFAHETFEAEAESAVGPVYGRVGSGGVVQRCHAVLRSS